MSYAPAPSSAPSGGGGGPLRLLLKRRGGALALVPTIKTNKPPPSIDVLKFHGVSTEFATMSKFDYTDYAGILDCYGCLGIILYKEGSQARFFPFSCCTAVSLISMLDDG